MNERVSTFLDAGEMLGHRIVHGRLKAIQKVGVFVTVPAIS